MFPKWEVDTCDCARMTEAIAAPPSRDIKGSRRCAPHTTFSSQTLSPQRKWIDSKVHEWYQKKISSIKYYFFVFLLIIYCTWIRPDRKTRGSTVSDILISCPNGALWIQHTTAVLWPNYENQSKANGEDFSHIKRSAMPAQTSSVKPRRTLKQNSVGKC